MSLTQSVNKRQKLNSNKKCVENIVLKLTDVQSRSFVDKYILFSIENIKRVIFNNESCPPLEQLKLMVPTMTHIDSHFLFFALLNVDVLLKDQICGLETEENLHKLVRFFVDLQKLFVQFFTNSEKTTEWVVNECKHLYLLA